MTLVLAALCAATLISWGQERSIVVRGSSPAWHDALVATLRSGPAKRPDSLDQAVIAWYARRGYLHASVLSSNDLGDTSYITLTEGPVSVVRDLVLHGVSKADVEAAIGPFVSRLGAVFTQTAVETDIEQILRYEERMGRILARVVVQDLQEQPMEDTTWMTITLRVEVGPEVRVEEVRFTGNTTTRSSTLLVASGIRVGEIWRAEMGETIRRRLIKTQLFSSVSEPRVDLSAQQRALVTVPVTENRHNAFDGILGYQPAPTGGSGGVVTGLVNLQFKNLLGTGRRLGVRWYQERQGRHEADLTYREPWLFGSDLAVGLEFHQRRQDSLYVRLRYAAELRGSVDEDLSVGANVSRSTTTPQEGYGARVLSGSSQTLAGLSLLYDTRDHPITPRSGSLYGTEYSTGRKSVGGSTGSTGYPTQRLRFDLGFYLSPIRGQTGVIEGHWTEVRGGAIDAADLSRLGGASDLRGYREGEFLGSRLAWGTIEYRFFVSDVSFVGMFVDGGSIYRPDLSSVGLGPSELFRAGAGMTMRVDTPVGLIGVSIAMGKGDGFGDAKLHVRVQNEF